MVFNSSKNVIQFNVIGYRRNKGEMNGKPFDNYILSCAQLVDPNKGQGYECFDMTLPLNLVDPKTIYRKNCQAEFNFYRDSKRQKILSIKVID